MPQTHPRIKRERKTVEAMIRLFCADRHGRGELCPACAELLIHAGKRLDKCPFDEKKPTCAHCPVHCYWPGMRDRIREVMRWSGPRMVWRHPVLAAFHLLDGRSTAPAPPASEEGTGK
jgi:hypothetical protein